MTPDELQLTDDPSHGEWLKPRLAGGFGPITSTIPSGYEAYARICHPARDQQENLTSWSEVANVTGRRAHPLMQWHALVGSPDPFNFTGSLWQGSSPDRGNLEPDMLKTLCGLLGEHTADPEHCFFAVWNGLGWVASGAILELPDREYLIFTGSLMNAPLLGNPDGPWGFEAQSPNLFWPTDHSWCVASEIDFDSTLVGGSRELVETILATSELDSWPIGPEDSLTAHADLINLVGEWSHPPRRSG